MKIYNKLVRDKIPEIMESKGVKPVTRILNDKEYIKELNRKLQEEVSEYLESENIEELADIEEVLLALLQIKNISKEAFEDIRKQKVLKRGAFDKKIFLEREE